VCPGSTPAWSTSKPAVLVNFLTALNRRPEPLFFNDAKLAELVDQARDVVNGLLTDELRQDANLRKYIADEMNQLRISVDGALEDLPRRKIRLAA
jgi:hypothetical protein